MPYLKWRQEIKDQRMRMSLTLVIEVNLNVDTTAAARKNAHPASFYSPLVLGTRAEKSENASGAPRTGFSAN